jgi:hypothetical protein
MQSAPERSDIRGHADIDDGPDRRAVISHPVIQHPLTELLCTERLLKTEPYLQLRDSVLGGF